jgi:hypothetical protein
MQELFERPADPHLTRQGEHRGGERKRERHE